MSRYSIDQLMVLLSIKMVQPGLLGDIADGIQRLAPTDKADLIDKSDVRRQLDRLVGLKLVLLYAGRRYMLTDKGRDYVAATGIRLKLDARRMFLLKETRQRSLGRRSGTRDGSLKQ